MKPTGAARQSGGTSSFPISTATPQRLACSDGVTRARPESRTPLEPDVHLQEVLAVAQTQTPEPQVPAHRSPCTLMFPLRSPGAVPSIASPASSEGGIHALKEKETPSGVRWVHRAGDLELRLEAVPNHESG